MYCCGSVTRSQYGDTENDHRGPGRIENDPVMLLTDAPSSFERSEPCALNRVRDVARLPTLAFIVHPGPRAINGPPLVNDTLVVARSRAKLTLDVQKFNQVTLKVPRRRPVCIRPRNVVSALASSWM